MVKRRESRERPLGRLMLALVAVWIVGGATTADAQAPTQRQVTFSKDIAPILQRSCQRCHRPESVAPMSLLTYEQARPYARAMKQRTAMARERWGRGAMPPWYIEKDIGIQRFKDDVSLSDEEIALVAAWADAGAPEGNPADLPPPLAFAGAAEWTLGKPDLIVSSPTVFVPAVGPDRMGAIGRTATRVTEDRYVSSVEFKEVSDFDVTKLPPGGALGARFVFHHIGVGIGQESDPEPDEAGNSGERGNRLSLHEVGRNGEVFAPEAGRLLPARSTLVFDNIHLHPPGVPGVERNARSDVGLRLHPKGYAPKYQIRGATFSRSIIQVNPLQGEQRLDTYFIVDQPMKLLNYEPHLHAAGVRMCLEAIYNGGVTETLNCAGYDHNWVRNYIYDDNATPLLPKGTILHAIAWFDNTAKNQNVTDPRNLGTFGSNTTNNMFLVFNKGIALTDEQYQEELVKRREYLRISGEEIIGCRDCHRPSAPTRATGSR